MAFYPKPTTDPVAALEHIRQQCPRADASKLRDIFFAVIVDNRGLQNEINARAFTAACEELRLSDGSRSG